jgi:threonyl-tRNA synthetase
MNRHGVEYKVKEGDAAFYGPKIDIDVRDAIGRKWQLSTIQCDFNLPERFGLEYIGSDNARHRPIMLHRALFGSVERFFGVLLEHYGGAFPTWLAPVQVRVLPVTTAHEEYAQALVNELRAQLARAILMPPGASPAAVEELRKAFDSLAGDKAFIAEHLKIVGEEPVLIPGADAQRLVTDAVKATDAEMKKILKDAAGVN